MWSFFHNENILKTIDRDFGLEKIFKTLGSLGQKTLKVGIQDDGELSKNQERISQIAYKNEYGIGVPARPAHRKAYDENQSKLDSLLKRLTLGVLENKIDEEKLLKILGETHQGFVREMITNLRQPPNSPLTIKLKKSDNPLIDTGQTRQSVRWIIEKK